MTVPAKWRPTLGMITAALIAGAILLPLSGLVFFRVYENQLLRQTEAELIAQSALLAAVLEREIAAAPEAFPAGAARPSRTSAAIEGRFTPIPPSLDLAATPILPRRPDPVFGAQPSPAALQVGARFEQVARQTQRTTLAGFRLLDAHGVVLSGAEVGGSLAHVEEVAVALEGRFAAVLRQRVSDEPPPPLYSISRGARIRIFAAMPVFVDDRVRGVVYISRTPDNIVRNLYAERERLAFASLLVLAAAAIVGALFVRAVTRPMHELVRRAERISRGDRAAIGPLPQHGTRELANLTEGFMAMAKRLFDRSDYLGTFATHVSHELKTPLASIKGAAELLRDADMSPEERARFLGNVLGDAERMSVLLDRLRELARAENPELGGATTLGAVFERLQGEGVALNLSADAALAMSLENAVIVFGHLVENASRHGASRVEVTPAVASGRLAIRVSDDGAGVSPANCERVFDIFFTTRRAEGGTGMGLGIVRALLRAHGGDITLGASVSGACFEITLPASG